MIRLIFPVLLVAIVYICPTLAQSPKKDVSVALGVQRAVAAAREHLRNNRPAEAVVVLESELVNADGSAPYLALLHDAYAARLRELQAKKADPAAMESVRSRLKALDGAPAASPEPTLGPIPAPSDGGLAADIRPPAPPIPAAPPEIPPAVSSADDPFQQTPRDSSVSSELPRASAAFAAKRYAQAASLFAHAERGKEAFTPAQKDEWAYCRLHAMAVLLNKGGDAATPEMVREVDEALRLGSERLQPFGTQIREELLRRGSGSPIPAPASAGWQVVESASFRIHHRGSAQDASEVSQTAEAARKAMFERWVGPPASDWAPRCDVYLHPSAAEYAKATGKSAEHRGHATVGMKGGNVVSRRLDLRMDDANLFDGTLPAEVTHVMLAELFVEQPLPRWAVVGMAALAESPEGVAQYRRAVPGLLKDKKLMAVGAFLDRADYPDAAAMTPFYAESVSLVSYLVELRGPKAFAAYLREAPRRGHAKALTTHYGFKDAAELQDKWVRHVMGGE